jgi:hypothetical protein
LGAAISSRCSAALPLGRSWCARSSSRSARSSAFSLLSPPTARNIAAFRSGLRDLGYLEGRNATLEIRYGDGAPERMALLAQELVAIKPDVLIVGGASGALAVHLAATRTIPIDGSGKNRICHCRRSALRLPSGCKSDRYAGEVDLSERHSLFVPDLLSFSLSSVLASIPDRTCDSPSPKALRHVVPRTSQPSFPQLRLSLKAML